eukprot:GHRQ01019623.1.p1 GENE.GHRQ01019623.1~~GHRQ01019623.1.p1  ORF type:complete len:135 (-),score=22.37 GHRQ01019623.1:202-606(-)
MGHHSTHMTWWQQHVACTTSVESCYRCDNQALMPEPSKRKIFSKKRIRYTAGSKPCWAPAAVGTHHPSPHRTSLQHVYHVVQLLAGALLHLTRQEQRCINSALCVDGAAAHIVLELERHATIWADELVGVEGVA